LAECAISAIEVMTSWLCSSKLPEYLVKKSHIFSQQIVIYQNEKIIGNLLKMKHFVSVKNSDFQSRKKG
jgi:hypothetical protein